jgi:hypothetical protein
MWTAARIFERVRPRVVAIVEHERRVVARKMDAYKRVAAKVGTSVMVLRRIVGRYNAVAIHAHLYFNVRDAYRAHRARKASARQHEAWFHALLRRRGVVSEEQATI